MIFTLSNLRFPVRRNYDLQREIARKLRIPAHAFELIQILRQAVDTRKFDSPIYDFSVLLDIDSSPVSNRDLAIYGKLTLPENIPVDCEDPHPYIIGMGPSALFCALGMVKSGFKPCLFDRGDEITKRAECVERFWSDGTLDEDSNVQFGEGGAGTFSDGKLTSRSKDPIVQEVFELMIGFGAPPEIAYEALPHLGTDGIRALVIKIRKHLLELGCRFFYRHTLQDIDLQGNKIRSATINGEKHRPETVILAPGNAARDTFAMLHKRGVSLESKPFSVGFRIEQTQATINRNIYGSERWAQILGPASYRLTDKNSGSYTFCMCPGGMVIGAASEKTGIVTNGMSFSTRNNKWCNSGVVTGVDEKDFGNGLFDGIFFQKHLEQKAFLAGYQAPVQAATDFVRGSYNSQPQSNSFRPGTWCCDFSTLFPDGVVQKLKSALQKFDQIINGFFGDALLIAPETRTSSPIRIVRDRNLMHSVSASNLYPVGEGSGYSGGIISSAADGLRLGNRFKIR
ncbi:MAG: hypothetical protein Q8M98_02745 [Candidatus Cloacimonadaceae bacterium]|nr:hypothetical protein [Candidatus Cloacimonadaceae bacterium]MDP3113672.1 hypothetical protein [Candidatus Cloacimonadaceae bacterium]